jgi:hypothetical protein
MINTPAPNSTTLKIWQQNLNTSHFAQLSLLNRPNCTSWDILALQEPYTNPLNNTTANRHYHVIYPSTRYTNSSKCVQAVTLISSLLNINNWTQIDFPSPDIVIVQLKGHYGLCTIINIYNDGKSDQTLQLLTKFLEDNIHTIKPTENDHMIWLGDFNRHHPLWEEEQNLHLLTETYLNTAELLIHLLAEYGMQQALPKNWTHPDNVFCTENMCQSFTHCYTDPSLRDCTDHVPILSTLELETPKIVPIAKHNFHETDWKEFDETLKRELAEYPTTTPIVTEPSFQRITAAVTQAIQTVIKETVPMAKYVPTSKQWWNHDLTATCKLVQKAVAESHKSRAIPEHPSHEQHHSLCNKYSEDIKKAKSEHWYNWLESANMADVWITNKYINVEPGDHGLSRIPTLKTTTHNGQQSTTNMNEDKSLLPAKTFFSPPPMLSTVPTDFPYPEVLPDPSPTVAQKTVQMFGCFSLKSITPHTS